MSSDRIMAAQRVLMGVGHNPGKLDGWWGAKTADAMHRALAAGSVELVARPVNAEGVTPAGQGVTPPAPVPAALRFPAVSRPLREIIVHCTATRPEWMAGRPVADKVAEVWRWHLAQGWRDIGYHYLIDRDGAIAPGRPLGEVGAHVMNRNIGTVGVALIGGHGSASTDQFAKNFTAAQDVALRQLIAALQAQFGPLALSGHNEWAAKACPGFNVKAWQGGQ
jgi:hypothetical protein